ncbi:hypothetical protein [Desulfofalx alkaliphila]|nr:hypothetical protein [Desulfofalx alkaliphila]
MKVIKIYQPDKLNQDELLEILWEILSGPELSAEMTAGNDDEPS